jgi:hypothetical protein
MLMKLGIGAVALVSATASANSSFIPGAGARAYLGRSPDGEAFFGYVTDTVTEAAPLEEAGPWPTIGEALAWARSRARQVVVTYGFTPESMFSAGAEYYEGGDPTAPLPEWPPEAANLDMLDRQVARQVASTPEPPTTDQLGVTEPDQTAED